MSTRIPIRPVELKHSTLREAILEIDPTDRRRYVLHMACGGYSHEHWHIWTLDDWDRRMEEPTWIWIDPLLRNTEPSEGR